MDRPYQIEQEDAVLAEYNAGVRHQLIVAATGTGKAWLIARLMDRLRHVLPGRALVFVHREELVDQLIDTMRECNPTLKVGKEMGKHYADTDCDVIVACTASIGREGSERMLRHGWDSFDKVICDECHHVIAGTYMNILEATGVLKPGNTKLLLGVTATPRRRNKRHKKYQTLDDDATTILSLRSVFQKIVHKYPIRRAIKEGWLVPLKGFRLKTDVNLDDVGVSGGEYQAGELQDTINVAKRNLQIVKGWADMCEGRQTAVFCVGIQHAKDMALAFRLAGFNAEAVWGEDPERAAKIARFRNGGITLLCSCDLIIEGFDVWQIRCILDAAPTKSDTKFTQKIGRGTRLQAGTGNLLEALANGVPLAKTDCYVLDVVDNNKRCSLVTFPTLVGLNPDMELHGMDVVKAAETLEAAQERHPHVDFSGLTDIANIKAYVESVDLFASPYSEEIKEYSKLAWMASADGGYTLAIPERQDLAASKAYHRFVHEKLVIEENELGTFDLSLSTAKETKKLGVLSTLQSALITADDVIARCRPDRLKLLTREAEWHTKPASEPVKSYLRKLTKKKPLQKCTCPGTLAIGEICTVCAKPAMSAGEASLALNVLKNK